MATNIHEDQTFLIRLTAIVEINLSNEQFGVKELAQKTGLSRSQIHRRLKSICNKSVSQFIREIRLEKAKEFLEEGNLTGSEIAFNVGFGSPSYFIKSFHDYFGYPPGEVKKRIPANGFSENETDKESRSAPEDLDVAALFKNDKKSARKKIVQASATVLAIIGMAFFFYFVLVDNDNALGRIIHPNKELSIIVLPFKNLSGDLNNQYFADGITEDILDNLFRITALRVLSRTSAEQFRESTLSASEIARKMKVNYVLEGSVRQYDNKTRISVQLIDAFHDKHLLSTNFDRELTDIIGVQGEIALQVAQKLDAIISNDEVNRIEKISTQNPEAYDLYLRARFLHHKANSPQRSGFDAAGVIHSIEYYKKAIAEDPGFAEAYAGLANATTQLTAWGIARDTGMVNKVYQLCQKAISLDPECAEAHAVLGLNFWFRHDYEKSGEEYRKAIELNPNFATARQWYAQYLMITGPIEEARKQVDYALELEPYFWVIQNLNSWIYYFEEKYDKALVACTAAHDFNPDFSSNDWLFVINYAKLGEGEKMVQKLQEIAKNYSKTENYTDEIIEAYNKSGINGLFYWLIEVNKNKPIKVEGMSGNPFFIAWWNAILGNKEEAIYWLEKTVKYPHPPYHYFNLITTNPDFDILRDDPRFLKVVNDIGLTQYHKRKAK